MSVEYEALEALAATLLALHPGGTHRVVRNSAGFVEVKDGDIVVETDAPDFLVFAVKNQGYGLDARRLEDVRRRLLGSRLLT